LSLKRVRLKLQALYAETLFLPGVLGLFINPYYFARKGLEIHVRDLASHMTGKTLDVGCGSKPYQKLCPSSDYIGLELDSEENRATKSADCFYDGHRIPFEDASFDSVLCNQVLEHVFDPDELLLEIKRILKPGGKLLITVPFLWNEHEEPLDFARYSSYGLKYLLQKQGFEILESRKSVNDIRVVFQLFNLFLNQKIKTANGYLNLLLRILLLSPVNILGALLARITPRCENLYLDNVLLARKS
jgi:SAM-dependent methyltransferase